MAKTTPKTKKTETKKISVKEKPKPVSKKLPKTPKPIETINDPSKLKYLSNKELLAEVKNAKAKGYMTDNLARMLMLLCSRYSKKGNFVNYCVDEATQTLTKRGWVSCDNLSTNDEILSYDINNRTLVWSKVFGIYINPSYDGKMHHLTTQGMDALVTPGHKFVSVERGIVNVEDIICNEHIVLTGFPVNNSETHFTDAFVQVVGWAVTKGHYSTKSVKQHTICISQKEGAKSFEIERCLVDANIPFKRYVNKQGIVRFNCRGKDISHIHQTIAPNRIISPEFILKLSTSQRHLLIKTMIAGDGWIRPQGGMSYVQKDLNHINTFLMLCTLAGYTTSTNIQTFKTPRSGINPEGGTSDCYVINLYATPKLQCKSESINFHGGRCDPGGRREQKQNLPTQDYKGVIWCPQTEHGTFVCRRGSTIYVTGNSYNQDMQAFAMLMLVKTWNAFDPEKSDNPFAFFTQCIHHSFIQYLNQEKRQRIIKDEMLIDQGLNPSFGYEGVDSEKEEKVFEEKVVLPDSDEQTEDDTE